MNWVLCHHSCLCWLGMWKASSIDGTNMGSVAIIFTVCVELYILVLLACSIGAGRVNLGLELTPKDRVPWIYFGLLTIFIVILYSSLIVEAEEASLLQVGISRSIEEVKKE